MSGAEPKTGATDVSLVWAIRSGDESAMATLYDRYSSVVYAVVCECSAIRAPPKTCCRKYLCSYGEIPAAFDASRGNLGAWLAVIARNRAIDMLRKRRPETDIADVVVSVEPDMAGEAERSRAMEKVRGTLGGMPAAQRSALEMAYFEGLTHTEIAAKTGEPLGTIKTRIRAGLRRCERCLKHERPRTIRRRSRTACARAVAG